MFIGALIGSLLLLFVLLIRRYGRLSKIPGPLLAAITDIWRLIAMNKPGYGETMVKLHRRYGHIVRTGPNQVSISDPTAIGIIYSTNPVWVKANTYGPVVPVSNGQRKPSIIAMSESQHTAVRKASGAAFTSNALLDYEDYIDESCNALVSSLTERLDDFDLTHWFKLFAMDVINRIAFRDSLGFIGKGDDVDGLLAAAQHRFDRWNKWAALPNVENFLTKGIMSTFHSSQSSPLARVGQAKMAKRENSGRSEDVKDLLDKFVDGKTKHEGLVSGDEVLGMIMSTIAAGADTTLRKELGDQSLSDPPKWTEVQHLQYLDAVIREAMRILPVAGWELNRIVPPGGAEIAGFVFPEGTVVGSQIDAVQRDTAVFGGDADDFNPQRWIDADEEQRRMMDRAFLAFGAGKRICLGFYIARLELKKLVPFLIMKLDIEHKHPDIRLVDQIKPSAVRYLPPIYATAELR